MKLILLLCLMGVLGPAMAMPAKTDFSGTWRFNAATSKNVGMMSRMELTSTIQQSASLLLVKDRSSFNGQESTLETRYDLSGKAASNKNFMGENSETTTRWSGDKLVTTWKTEGAIAGTTVIRIETRSLSPDAKVMTLESVRASNPPIVMVFDKQ